MESVVSGAIHQEETLSTGGGMLTIERIEVWRDMLLKTFAGKYEPERERNTREINALCDGYLRSLPAEGMPPEPEWLTQLVAGLPESTQGTVRQHIDHLRAVAEGMAADAARYRWLRERINYRDEERSTSEFHHAPDALTWRVRCWKHDSNEFMAKTLDQAIDAALSSAQEEPK